MSDAQESVIRRYYHAVFGTGNTNVTAFELYLVEDFIAHDRRLARGGCEGYMEFMSMLTASFSDMHHSVCDMFGRDDRVVARWQWTGRHTAEFMGLAATNRPVVVKGIDIFRVVDGRIAELWQEIDYLDILQQIRAPQGNRHDERCM